MCGIAGLIQRGAPANPGEVAVRMVDALLHRGPDSGGSWSDAQAGVGLGHRRLAILDLSPAGAQPMVSASGRFVIAFNGEIYNHLDLRRDLAAMEWRGQSDTETLLAAFEAWGLEATLARCTGMFAIALWDRETRELTLMRDRLGEKPLYYGWRGDAFLFGSELKALAAHPRWQAKVDRDALALFLRRGYVPACRTIWTGIQKLPPGGLLRMPVDAVPGTLPEPALYWRAAAVASAPAIGMADEQAAADRLEQLLRASIGRQMIADVPLGAFLSGGVDSSTVVALMQAQSARPVRTFTVGFTEAQYDESAHALAVARHLGTEHTEIRVSPADAMAVIPDLPRMYDEPFGDSSQIPTHLVCALARRHVTVSLSGDGGDELFGGYNHYFRGRMIWERIGRLPRPLRAGAGLALRALSPETWDRFAGVMPRRLRQPNLGDRLHKLAGVLDVRDPDELHLRLTAPYREPAPLVLGAAEPPGWADSQAATFAASPRGRDYTERMMFHDLVDYLCEDILTKVDRAAMAVSLETRVPLLDHALVAYAWSLPPDLKIRDGQGKWLLRQVLYRHVPRELIERPKQGFSLPVDNWLRGPLRDWAEGLLDEARLRREGFLDVAMVRRKWAEHLSGRRNWQHMLWHVLMFQAWRERWV